MHKTTASSIAAITFLTPILSCRMLYIHGDQTQDETGTGIFIDTGESIRPDTDNMSITETDAGNVS